MVPFSTVHPPYNKAELTVRRFLPMKAVEQTKRFIKDCYGLDGHPVLDRQAYLFANDTRFMTAAEINDTAISLLEEIINQTPLIRLKEKSYAAN